MKKWIITTLVLMFLPVVILAIRKKIRNLDFSV